MRTTPEEKRIEDLELALEKAIHYLRRIPVHPVTYNVIKVRR